MKTVKTPKKSTMPKPAARKTTVRAVPPITNSNPTVVKVAAAETKAAKPTRTAATTIEAHIDVGFGNQLFVRGQGAGLSWDKGMPLKNVDAGTWQWSAEASDKLTFKLLLNDAVWAQGADVIAAPGQKVEITPNF